MGGKRDERLAGDDRAARKDHRGLARRRKKTGNRCEAVRPLPAAFVGVRFTGFLFGLLSVEVADKTLFFQFLYDGVVDEVVGAHFCGLGQLFGQTLEGEDKSISFWKRNAVENRRIGFIAFGEHLL